MPNLSKLDETINQIEKQADMLKHNNGILAKIAELSTAIKKGADELVIGNERFERIQKDIQGTLKSLNDGVNTLEKENEKHMEALITSNKKSLRELEDTVSSKLERFSSDIQVSIRQERAHLQEALQNNLTSQFNNQEAKQKDLFAAQAKQITLLRILLIIIIGLCIGMSVKLFL